MNRPNLIYRNERNCSFTKITDGIIANKIYNTNPGNNWLRRRANRYVGRGSTKPECIRVVASGDRGVLMQ